MNKKQIYIENKKLKDLIKRESTNNRRGCAKFWKGVTKEHWRVMCDIVWKLVNQGYEVYTEAEFVSGGRADVVAIINGSGFIIEVLHTETEERYSAKFNKYPKEFFMIKVKTKGFKIDNFDI